MELTLDGIRDAAPWQSAGVLLPGYDVPAAQQRAVEAPRWVHFGIGNIFRVFLGGIVPDILLAGKGMSNGFGLGAMLMSRQVGSSIRPWEMSGGSADNDLMCGIVNTVFDIFEEEKILQHVQEMGSLLQTNVQRILMACGIEGKFRGKGLFCSLELPEGMAASAAAGAKARGAALGGSGNKLLFRPPLVITKAELLQVCSILQEVLEEL